MEESLLDSLDRSVLDNHLDNVESNAVYFKQVVDSMVQAQTSHMDAIMQSIYNAVCTGEETPLEELEQYYMELTNVVYFMGVKMDDLDMKAGLAKKSAKEVFNNAYLGAQVKDVADKRNKTTVQECTSIAEKASIYDSTVQDMYEHACSCVKFKIQAAQEMIRTLSKLLSRRIAELQLSNGRMPSGTGRQKLMEDFNE